MAMYGRDEETWERLTEAGLRFLLERARLRGLTSYTELNAVLMRRTGLPGFDFSRADERAAMGHLLFLIVERDLPRTNLMLSALVKYLDRNDAGSGFYELAKQLGLLPCRASAKEKEKEKEAFWIGQVNGLYDYYVKPERPPAD